MEVVTVPIDEVKPYPNNPRKNADAVGIVAASLTEFGWRQPIVVDRDFVVVVGHTRLLAAKSLGMEKVPVHVALGLSPEQIRAYRLADNRTGEEAEWDDGLLALEIGDLAAAGFDLAATGFNPDELTAIRLHGSQGLTDPDEAPALPEVAITRPGDVWLLRDHRICCGDSTKAEDVGKALNGARPHLMVTDPPYGVEYDPARRNRAGVGSAGQAVGRVMNDDVSDWRAAWQLFPGSVAYVWHAGTLAGSVANSLAACKFAIRAQIVWVKQRHVLSRGDYHHQHEPALYAVLEGADEVAEGWGFVPEHEIAAYAVRAGQPGQYRGGRRQSTVWFIEHVKSETGHGTQKPVTCMQRPIENNSQPGQFVYEPFSGSGTTIMAAEITRRVCLALELSPEYVDVAVRRWEEFTGMEATLDGDGRTFAEIAHERG